MEKVEHMEHSVIDWFDKLLVFGPLVVYIAIFLACFIENIFPPFPGDTVILLGAVMVHLGKLSPWPTALVSIGGGLLSVFLIYLAGEHWGRGLLLRGKIPFVSPSDLQKAESLFAKWGGWVVLASRFLFGVRSILNFLAGSARFPLLRFMLLSTVSYILFVALLFVLGFVASDSFETLSQLTGSLESALSIILIALLVGWILVRLIWKKKIPS